MPKQIVNSEQQRSQRRAGRRRTWSASGAGSKDARSMADLAYDELKRRIITLVYEPGSYVNEGQLCEDLGVGRTPVHQAIKRLSHEGMINVIPRKGNIVAPLSVHEALAVFEARLLVEPGAARLAAERASSEEIDQIEQLLKEGRGLVEQPNVEAAMNIDRKFHGILAHATRNSVLEQILVRLHERSLRHWFISLSDKQSMADIAEEHEQILDMLRRRDGEGVERRMREHIEISRNRIRGSN